MLVLQRAPASPALWDMKTLTLLRSTNGALIVSNILRRRSLVYLTPETHW